MTMSRSNSRSSRSWMISRWSRPEEAAAEAQAQGRAALGLVLEAGVVEPQLGQAVAQIAVLVGVGRVHAAEHDRLAGAKPRQRAVGGLAVVGDGVADPGVGDLLDRGRDEPDLARPQPVDQQCLGGQHADAVDQVGGTVAHEADLLALLQRTVLHPHQRHHAQIAVVPGIDHQRLQRCLRLALRRRQAMDDRLQHVRRRRGRSWPRSSGHRWRPAR